VAQRFESSGRRGPATRWTRTRRCCCTSTDRQISSRGRERLRLRNIRSTSTGTAVSPDVRKTRDYHHASSTTGGGGDGAAASSQAHVVRAVVHECFGRRQPVFRAHQDRGRLGDVDDSLEFGKEEEFISGPGLACGLLQGPFGVFQFLVEILSRSERPFPQVLVLSRLWTEADGLNVLYVHEPGRDVLVSYDLDDFEEIAFGTGRIEPRHDADEDPGRRRERRGDRDGPRQRQSDLARCRTRTSDTVAVPRYGSFVGGPLC